MQNLSFLSYNWNTGDQMHSIRACLVYYFIKWNLLKYLFKLTFIGFCENSQFIIPLYCPNCGRVQRFSFSFYFSRLYFRIALSLEKQRNKRTLKPNPSSWWKLFLCCCFRYAFHTNSSPGLLPYHQVFLIKTLIHLKEQFSLIFFLLVVVLKLQV